MTKSIGEVVAERLRRYRTQQGLTQQQVADRTELLGSPISRHNLAKLETPPGRAKVPLTDVLVLAAALDVPPTLLFLPLGEDEEVEVTPGNNVHPHLAFKWVKGTEDFTRGAWSSPFDPKQWARNTQPIRLFDKLELLQAGQELTTLQPEVLDEQGDWVKNEKWAERQNRVDEHLAYMRDAGLSIPKDIDDGER
jgi:transcriptional regulator with XRE-family HTH domain